MLVGGQHARAGQHQRVGPRGRGGGLVPVPPRFVLFEIRVQTHGDGRGEVGELAVVHPGRPGQDTRHDLGAGSALRVGVPGPHAEDQVTTSLGVADQRVEQLVVGDVQAGHDQDRDPVGKTIRGYDRQLSARLEEPPVESPDNPVVRVAVRHRGPGCQRRVRQRQRRLELARPPALRRGEHSDVDIRHQTGQVTGRGPQLGTHLGQLAVAPARLEAVTEHPAPERLVPGTQRVPLPVLDHAGTAGHQRPNGLPPLPVVRRIVHMWLADGARPGLGHQERFATQAVRGVGLLVERPHPAVGQPLGAPGHRVPRRLGQGQGVLHREVHVDRGLVADGGHRGDVQRRPAQRQAGHHELVGPGQLAHHRRLPADEARGQLRLEAAPREVVRGHRVAVRRPQVGPVREPV